MRLQAPIYICPCTLACKLVNPLNAELNKRLQVPTVHLIVQLVKNCTSQRGILSVWVYGYQIYVK